MNHNAALEDSMAPDRLVQPNKLDRLNAQRWRHAQELKYGRDWRDTLILLLAEEMTSLKQKVKDLELMQSA